MKLIIAWSGGGSKGDFQVGVANLLSEYNIKFKYLVGTSTGNLQASLYAQDDVKLLNDIWLSLNKNSKIYKHWLPPLIPSLWKKGLYNASPLIKLIDKNINLDKLISSKQRFISCSINLNTMQKHYVEATEENRNKIKPFIYASAAFPMAFQPLQFDGFSYWDGGLMEPIPARKATEMCPDFDYLIIVLAGSGQKKTKEKIGPTIFHYLGTVMEAMTDEIFANDLNVLCNPPDKNKLLKHYVDNNKIIIIEPPFDENRSSLDFNVDQFLKWRDIGYEKAYKALKGIII